MKPETLKIIITELFNLLEARFTGRPLISLLLPVVEQLALSLVDQLMGKLKERGVA